jgi:hypothetical protein
MIIKRISLIPLRIPLVEPFIISLGPLTHAENVLVKMEREDGSIGWGECSPFRSIHGENIATCMAIGKEIAAQLIHCEVTRPDQLLQLMDRTVYGNTSIKSAFDIAFHDLLSREKEVPLYKLLGGTSTRTLFTDYTISLSSREKMTADAVKIIDNGFPVVKVKLGGTPTEDIERIQAIRAAIGYATPIRIDANQGWDLSGATIALNALEQLKIQVCEEPLPRWKYHELPSLRRAVKIPLMADESCFDEHDAQKLIALQACDGFNIKLGKSSGIVRAQRIAELANNNNILLQVGGFLESRLGFTAAAHFAMAHPQINYIDFDTPLMFTEDPIGGGITYGNNGSITLSDQPGLGASLKPDSFRETDQEIVQ